MISVTADTNIYVSAFAFAGQPRHFLMKAEGGRFRLAISQPILDGLQGVLRAKFFWPEAEIATALSQLAGCAVLARPTQTLDVVPDDPDDNRVIECAVAAGSDYLVLFEAEAT